MEELKGSEKEEIVVRMYCIREESIFKNRSVLYFLRLFFVFEEPQTYRIIQQSLTNSTKQKNPLDLLKSFTYVTVFIPALQLWLN